MSSFDNYIDRREQERLAGERQAIDNQVSSALSAAGPIGVSTMDPVTGMVRPGPAIPEQHVGWKDLSQAPLQGDHNDLNAWAKTSEGQRAVAEHNDRSRPRPKLYEVTPGLWRYVSSRNEIWQDTDRQSLLEKVVFGNQTHEQIRKQVGAFMKANPDYLSHATPFLYAEMLEWLGENEYFLSSQSLSMAWKKIKPTINTAAHRAAAKGYVEQEAVLNPDKPEQYAVDLSSDELDEAHQLVNKVRGKERD